MSAPVVSVLVVSSGYTQGLIRLLRILREQSAGLGAERVLVVNAARESIDNAQRAELAADCNRLEFEPAPGKSRALNRGVDFCRGDVIAFTDDDVEPAPGWLARLTGALVDPSRDPRLVACGGPVVPVYDAKVPAWYRALVEAKPSNFLGPRHVWGDEGFDYSLGSGKRGGVPIGANVAIRREVFERERYDADLGPNRVTGFRGAEDSALARRLLGQGLRIRYVPDAVVRHPISSDRSSLDFVRRAHIIRGRERVKLARKLDLPIPPRTTLWKRMWLNRLRTPLRRVTTGNPHPPEEFRWRYQRGMLREIVGSRREPAEIRPKEPPNSL